MLESVGRDVTLPLPARAAGRWFLRRFIYFSCLYLFTFALLQNLAFADSRAASPTEQRKPLIVFYANETTTQASGSKNYAALISALRESSNPAAAAIADSLVRDAKEYPVAVRRDSEQVLAAARRLAIDAAIFTNALALDRRYLFYRAASGNIETRSIPDMPPATNPVLTASPLARPDFFRVALHEVGSLYPNDSLDVVLITASHGNDEMALMPRVFADLSQVNFTGLSALLDSGSATNDRPPNWASYQGTDKVEYWRIIAEAAASFGMRFPLVFRAACESGLSGWGEYFAVPESVGIIAHTSNDGLKYDQVNYSAAFAPEGRETLISTITAQLIHDGIHVDTRRVFWLRALWGSVSQYYVGLFFIPLIIWLSWFALSLLKLSGNARAEVTHRH